MTTPIQIPAIKDSLIAHRDAAIKRFQAERDCGKATGNYGLTTSAGFRLAVATFDPAKVYDYLLNEMGIKAPVVLNADGLQISFGRFNHHSHATVIRELQYAFRVMSLMHEDGSQVVKIMGLRGAPTKEIQP